MPSNYFSPPSQTLDPHLFEGDKLHEDTRTGLLNALYSGLENELHLNEPWDWTHAWIAGSAITYQWDGAGDGDLDVLFGVDYPLFLSENPEFPALSEKEASDYIDRELKAKVWPKTSSWRIHGRKFEVTFFWNPGTTTDISVIHPYAAYSLTNDRWDIRPPELPDDPHTLYPKEWYDRGDSDYRDAIEAQTTLAYSSSSVARKLALDKARSMWEDIHGGRRGAFSDVGQGYSDFRNFRWQRAKDTGVVPILRNLVAEADKVDLTQDTALYGHEIESASDIRVRAAMRYAKARYA